MNAREDAIKMILKKKSEVRDTSAELEQSVWREEEEEEMWCPKYVSR